MMKKILIGINKWKEMAVSYYGQSQIAYYVENEAEKEVPLIGIPKIRMADLKDDLLKKHEIIICASNYWEVAETLENLGIQYVIFPPICDTWPALSQNISHSNWKDYLAGMFDKPDVEILEIGSRKVTDDNVRSIFKYAKYTGMDIYHGENVDIVGDAHYLSSYFEPGRKFDLILSSAVFEHLAMPWKVVEEISKLLKIGGHFFVETHFSHSYHEKPWMFFQFSDMGLRVLFNKELGFEVIEAGCSNPLQAKFSCAASDYLKGKNVGNLWCHSEIFGKKIAEAKSFSWDQVNINELVNGTSYPASADSISVYDQLDMIRESLQKLLTIEQNSDLKENIPLYQAVTEMLEVSIGYLDKVWEQTDISWLEISKKDWKAYKNSIADARDRMIDLEETVIPFTRMVLEKLN